MASNPVRKFLSPLSNMLKRLSPVRTRSSSVTQGTPSTNVCPTRSSPSKTTRNYTSTEEITASQIANLETSLGESPDEPNIHIESDSMGSLDQASDWGDTYTKTIGTPKQPNTHTDKNTLENSAKTSVNKTPTQTKTNNRKNETQTIDCTLSCKYRHRSTGTMTRCCICMLWFHDDCVTVESSDLTSVIWNCPTCRRLPVIVTEIQCQLQALSQTNDDLVKHLSRKVAEADELNRENAALRDRLKQLESAHGAPIKKKTTLLIGDSMVKNIDSIDSGNRVTCKPGATMDDISLLLSDLSSKGERFEDIIIHCGTNNCQNDDSDIGGKTELLLTVAKDIGQKVTISSVCPRTDQHQDKVDSINQAIYISCETHHVTFINNQDTFLLKNGEVNKANISADGVHLTPEGERLLLKNLQLENKYKIKNPQKTYKEAVTSNQQTAPHQRHTPNHTKRQRDHHPGDNHGIHPRDRPERLYGNHHQYMYTQASQQRHTPNHINRQRENHNGDDNECHPTDRPERFYGNHHQYMKYRDNRRLVRCHNCSEIGHVKRDCRLSSPVVCRMCKGNHKEKFCDQTLY